MAPVGAWRRGAVQEAAGATGWSASMEEDVATGSVFENNRTQAVRIPAEMRFAAGVRKVNVRVMGPDRVLSPVDRVWDMFFLEEAEATDEVRIERGEQGPPEGREPLE